MTFNNHAPANPKYRTPEHRAARRAYTLELARVGVLECVQPVCIEPTRTINAGTTWHVGHNDAGDQIIGPVHATCNIRDGVTRGNRRSRGLPDHPTTHWEL